MDSTNYAGVRINPHEFDEQLLKRAIEAVRKGGRLDVLVTPPPPTIEDAEQICRKLYAYAPPRPSELDFTVLFNTTSHSKEWEFEIEPKEDGLASNLLKSEIPQTQHEFIGKYDTVAVGGTWDHMHWGHRLMLTLAAYTARNTVVIGVTSSELLVNKKYSDALESYDSRVHNAKAFVKYLCPEVNVDAYPLDNMYGPTITVKNIEALVVSAETSKGGGQVNEKRIEMNWPSLDILEAGLILGPSGNENEKLSSTDLRREQLEQENYEKL